MTKLLPILIALLIFAGQYLYYDDFLPNTAYLKADGTAGMEYFFTFLFKEFIYAPIYIGAVIYAYHKKNYRMLLFVLGWTAYVTYAGEDAFNFSRFFITIIPLIVIGFSRGVKKIIF